MPTQHRLIPDAELHQTKGIASATVDTVQVATGTGNGVWKKLPSSAFQGTSGDAGVADKILVSDGSGGFVMRAGFAYGNMGLVNNTNAFTITAASDATLNTNSDYQLFTGTGAPFTSGLLSNTTFALNALTVGVTGVYKLSIAGQVTTFPSTVAKVGMKYRINSGTFSPRRSMTNSATSGDIGQINLDEIVSLTAGDVIQTYIASTVAGGVTLSDLSVNIELIKAT